MLSRPLGKPRRVTARPARTSEMASPESLDKQHFGLRLETAAVGDGGVAQLAASVEWETDAQIQAGHFTTSKGQTRRKLPEIRSSFRRRSGDNLWRWSAGIRGIRVRSSPCATSLAADW